jgi:uncharacterized membrane protein YfcA
MPVEAAVILILCGGVLIQALVGFGSALIAMPLLIQLIGIRTAAPLFALVAITIEALLILRYRHTLRWEAVQRLVIGALCGIPLGIIGARAIDERLAMLLLGLLTAGYGMYALLGLKVHGMQHPNWGYGIGFISGLLSGAYNTGGPPYVIYGTSQAWQPVEFKANLQSVFVVNSITVNMLHWVNGGITPNVAWFYVLATPVVLVTLWIGFRLDKRINPTHFRKIVLILLVIIGLSLIF